ncbi:MAG: response regulator [Bacilli bacterium]|nr:response regulator [Bacilli bacterium]
MEKIRLAIIDDEPINLQVLSKLLMNEYNISVFKSGESFLSHMDKMQKPSLILLDIIMPGLDGYQTLRKIKEYPEYQEIPVIFITSLDSSLDEEKGFNVGAMDYIIKPFKPVVVKKRIRVQLELKEARDFLKEKNEWLEDEVTNRIKETIIVQDVTLGIVTQLVETRDLETGNHIYRTSRYMEILAKKLKTKQEYKSTLTSEYIELITKAAPLHDIGKIGIPDSILLKPGKLTPEEYEIMKTHVQKGADAISLAIKQTLEMHAKDKESSALALRFLDVAHEIILYHHERWDGLGYPGRLVGSKTPIPGRMMALADVFDALTTPRVYKAAWSFDEATKYIKEHAKT